MIPKTYEHVFNASQLQGDDLMLESDGQDLDATLESVGFPKRLRGNITAAIIRIGDADFDAVWLSEDARYYELGAWYHPLPYYRPKSWAKSRLPIYWKEENPYYQVKE